MPEKQMLSSLYALKSKHTRPSFRTQAYKIYLFILIYTFTFLFIWGPR